MSLLISRDYANKTTPLWLSAAGGTITGSLTVQGDLGVYGNAIVGDTVSGTILEVVDASGNPKMTLANDSAGNSLIQSTDVIKFTQLGTATGNTQLTLSSAGANLDNFSVGGTMNCLIGPVPTQIITSTKSVPSIAVSPASPSQFGVDTTVTSISGAEYDVQVTGTVFCASGTVNPADYIVYNFTAGGSGTISAIVFPGELLLGANGVTGIGPLVAAGAAATVTLRARVVSSAAGTTLGANVRAFLTGTAVYGATLTVCDVQRVR